MRQPQLHTFEADPGTEGGFGRRDRLAYGVLWILVVIALLATPDSGAVARAAVIAGLVAAAVAWAYTANQSRRSRHTHLSGELRRAQASVETLEELLASSPVVTFLWRSEEGWPVEYVSTNARQPGYDVEKFISETPSFEAIIHPEDLPRVQEEIAALAAGTQAESVLQYRLRVKNGQIRWVEDRIAVHRDAGGNPTHFQSSMLDITGIKASEEALVQMKETAEAASRVKGAFLATMSHEIRTPLNGILGMTDLTLSTELTDEQRVYLELVQSSAETLTRIIDDILDISRFETGELTLTPMPFDLRDMLGDALHALAPRAHAKETELVCEVHPDVPDRLVGDSRRIRQVLDNLIANGVKYTGAGEVCLEVDCSSSREETLEFRFRVRDTGTGIPPDKQRLICDAFSQASGGVTRQHEGVGRGLTISARLVWMMGGEISLQSTPDEGSAFEVTIPLTPIQSAAPVPDEAEAPRAGARVLVVDDNATSRRVLADLLRGWDLEVATADGAMEALRLVDDAAIEGWRFDLALVDVNMPGMDGTTLSRVLVEQTGLTMPVVLMSDYRWSRHHRDSIEAREAAATLMKPVRISALRKLLQDLLGPGDEEELQQAA